MSKEKDSAPSTSAPPKSRRSKAHPKYPNFGDTIRRRRRELHLTLKEVGARIETSKPYVAHLESGHRHPSDKIVLRLSQALGLDSRELFFLANPRAQALVSGELERVEGSAWEQFRTSRQLRRIYNISNEEMEVLSRVALLGEFHSTRDLIYVLTAIRHAVGR
jgi:transcriptional regulator with XRE-family HTH domain